MQTALNHMTVPKLGYVPFLDLAAKLGCVGVEVRNDIRRALFDDIDPTEAGRIARDKGLRLVGLSQVYPFNDWTPEREDAVKALIATAKASGAETISLIPATTALHLAIANGVRISGSRSRCAAATARRRDSGARRTFGIPALIVAFENGVGRVDHLDQRAGPFQDCPRYVPSHFGRWWPDLSADDRHCAYLGRG